MKYLDDTGLAYFWSQIKTFLAGKQAKITASGMLKGDGNGGVTAAVAGTDYIASHQDISGKVDKSGDTMTGALTLSGAPTNNLHAATKKYVDDNKGSKTTVTTATLAAASWSNAGVYSALQTNYPAASYDLEIEPNGDSITTAQMEAWSAAQMVGSATTNTIKALGTVPTVDIPIILKYTPK